MALTPRQLETIKNIKIKGIISPVDIIKYCFEKIKQPNNTSYLKHPNALRTKRRRHSKLYYQQIISFYQNK